MKKIPEIHMLIDGKPVEPFNRDTQKIKEKDIPIFLRYEIKKIGSKKPRGLFKRFGD